MKKLFLAAFVLALTPITALGQVGTATVTATGNFTLSGSQVLSLQAQIVGCSGNVPLYQNTPISITPNQSTPAGFSPTSGQSFTFTLPGNDQVTCGGQTYSMYAITWKIDGFPASPTKTYRFADSTTTNLNLQIPISFVPPVIVNGAGYDCPSGQALSGFDSNYQPHCSAVVSTVMPVVTNPGIILTNPLAGNNYQAQPNVFFSQTSDTLSSIESQCASVSCTYVVTQPQTITLTANHTLSANVILEFWAAGKWIVNGPGFTLTISNVRGGPTQHFAGTGSVKFDTTQSQVAVEWFGAVGDWNGTTGTDNTTTIQTAINSLSTGQVTLLGKSYKVSSALSITKSGVGIRGVTTTITSATQYAAVPASTIVQTSASADIVDVAGTSTSNNVGFNRIEYVALKRSVLPTGTARGLSLNYTYGVHIESIDSEDSFCGIYVHASGSQGLGLIENSGVMIGGNGITETSGTYSGLCMDSTDGVASPSFRVRHSFFVNNTGNYTTVTGIGINIYGTSINDLMVYGFETAHANYGVYINVTAGGSAIGSQDLHFYGTINDDFRTTGFYINHAQSPQSSTIEINGGWNSTTATGTSGVDIEQSNGVEVNNLQIGQQGSHLNNAILVNNSTNCLIANNMISNLTLDGIVLINSSSNVVSGNNVSGGSVTTALIRLQNSPANAITGNMMGGSGTNALTVDSTSLFNTGLDTNGFNGTFTTTVKLATASQFNFMGTGTPGNVGTNGTTACNQGNKYDNLGTTVGTYAAYICKSGAWVGLGTAY